MFISYSTPAFNSQAKNRLSQQQLTFAGKQPKPDRYKGIPEDRRRLIKEIEQSALYLNSNQSTHTLRDEAGSDSVTLRSKVRTVLNDHGRLIQPKQIIVKAHSAKTTAVNAMDALQTLLDDLRGIKKQPRVTSQEAVDLDFERQIGPEELPAHAARSGQAVRRGRTEERRVRTREADKPNYAGILEAYSPAQSNALKTLKETYARIQQAPDDAEAGNAFGQAQKKFRKIFKIPNNRRGNSQFVQAGEQEIPLF